MQPVRYDKVSSSLRELSTTSIQDKIHQLTELCHGVALDGGWWTNLETGGKKERNNGELLMLVVSEVAEAMEADRKGLMDDKLPHRSGVEVELADTIIRIFDYAGGRGLDLGGALAEKLLFNQQREDHKLENRKKEGGKKY